MTAATEGSVSTRREAIQALGLSFRRTMVAIRRLRGRDTQRPGTPGFAQYQLLFTLAGRDGLSTGELASAADLSPATVTQMLDSLVEMGFVTRDRTSADRRIVTCSLTGSGREWIEERRSTLERCWDEALSEFSVGDLAVAAAVFDRVAEMFDGFDEGL
jgi:DNA-binding MarR family transcriptional regulator